MFTQRLFVLGVIVAGLVVLWAVLAWRSGRFRRESAADLLSRHTGGRRPLVLAFSTPDCVPCRTVQRPALEQLLRRYPGRVEVREVDATVIPDLADRFGILTVPSTVVIEEDGTVVAINNAVAGWDKLALQLGLNGQQPKTG